MEKQKIKEVRIAPSYGGGVSVNAYLEDGTKCIVELEEAYRILLDIFNAGYTLELTPRQKYYRLKANK